MKKSTTYKEKLYSTYVSTHTSHLYGEVSIEGIMRQFPVWRRYYGRFLPENKDAKIIDLGCGNGGLVYYLKSLGYKNSSGIDISPEQVKVAKNLGINDVECADIVSFLQDKNDTYDVIFARDVIEHFKKEEIIELLRLIFNSLKQGG
jgi:2-polyprenyl-3-methyl-5-hydroxy-6-metoxy-1,4-benzoquinol methylase